LAGSHQRLPLWRAFGASFESHRSAGRCAIKQTASAVIYWT